MSTNNPAHPGPKSAGNAARFYFFEQKERFFLPDSTVLFLHIESGRFILFFELRKESHPGQFYRLNQKSRIVPVFSIVSNEKAESGQLKSDFSLPAPFQRDDQR